MSTMVVTPPAAAAIVAVGKARHAGKAAGMRLPVDGAREDVASARVHQLPRLGRLADPDRGDAARGNRHSAVVLHTVGQHQIPSSHHIEHDACFFPTAQ